MVTTVKEYDALQRAHAATVGHPIRRTSLPGIVVGDVGNQWLAQVTDWVTGVVSLMHAHTRHTTTVPFHEFTEWLLGDAETATATHRVVVFQDRATITKLVKWARNHTNDTPYGAKYAATARMLDVALALPFGAYVVALTDALTATHYAPTATDTYSLGSWAKAFNLHNMSMGEAMCTLLKEATSVDAVTVPTVSLSTSAYHALNAARFGASGVAAVKAFRSLTRTQNMWADLTASDPTLMDRNLLEGVATKLTVQSLTVAEVRGVVTQPFKFKEGRKVTIRDLSNPSQTIGESVLRQITTPVSETGDTMVVSLVSSTKLVTALRKTAGQDEFYLTESTFTPTPTKTLAGVWLGDPNLLPPIRPRDVPLEVVLAGAPENP